MDNPYEGVMFPVKTTVVEACGAGCRAPHAAGQAWLIKGVPPGICSFAFNTIFPVYWTLHLGGAVPSAHNPVQMHASCSVPGCVARFLVVRVSAAEAAELLAVANTITLEDLVKTFPTGLSRKLS